MALVEQLGKGIQLVTQLIEFTKSCIPPRRLGSRQQKSFSQLVIDFSLIGLIRSNP